MSLEKLHVAQKTTNMSLGAKRAVVNTPVWALYETKIKQDSDTVSKLCNVEKQKGRYYLSSRSCLRLSTGKEVVSI